MSSAISSQTNVNCFGLSSGSATVTASNGTLPYTYLWNTVPSQTSPTATGLASGSYSVTITDHAGCTSSASVTITQPATVLSSTISSQNNVNCFGQLTGSASVLASGGTAPYTYSWNTSPVQHTSSVSGLSAGTYSVIVTDYKGCTSMTSATITQPSLALSISNTFIDVTTSGGSNGSITLTVTGGTSPYSYLWSNGATTQNLVNIPAGVYSVVVTDAHGCSILSNEILISQPYACSGFRTETQGGWGTVCHGTNPGCYRDAHFASAFPSGLTIGCINHLTLTSAAAVEAFLPSGTTPSALPAGTLTNPGSTYSNVLAGQLVAATLNVGFDSTDANFAPSSGSLGHLIVTSGTFSGWSVNSLLAEANRAIGGCGSAYSYSALTTALDNINQNYDDGLVNGNFLSCSISLSISGVNTPCNGTSSGSATVIASDGQSPYTYHWSNGGTSSSVSGLSAGTYSVTVTDAHGISAIASITITQPPTPSTPVVTVVNNCGNSVLSTTATGSLLWSTGATTSSITVTVAGTYTVTQTVGQCTSLPGSGVTDPHIIPPGTTTPPVVTVVNNCGNSILSTTATGSLLWSTGATTSSITVTAGGTYSVTRTIGGTSSIPAYGFAEPKTLPVVDLGNDTYVCAKQSVLLDAGNSDASYLWTPGGQTSQSILLDSSGLSIGTHLISVLVTSPNSCSVSDSILVTFDQCASISEVNDNILFNINPNPSNGIFHLAINGLYETANLNIINMSGKIVYSDILNNEGFVNKSIDLGYIPKGMYFLRVISKNYSHVEKIIIN